MVASPLTQHLARLQSARLIQAHPGQADDLYQFRHSLLHEAAYSVLLRGQRRMLHQTVGEVLEAQLGQPVGSAALADLAPHLTLHFSLAEDDARTWRYARLAGDSAMTRFATNEAAGYYASALAAHGRLPAPEPEQLAEVYKQRGRALELSARYPEAEANYRAMLAEAEARHEPKLSLAALAALGILYSTFTPLHDVVAGEAHLHQARDLAQQLGDAAAEANVLWSLLLLQMYGKNRVADALELGEAALKLARQHELAELEHRVVNDLAWVHIVLGHTDRGLAYAAEAEAYWRATGNLPMVTDVMALLAGLHTSRGDYPAAVAAGQAGLAAGVASANAWGQAACQGLMSYALVELGEFRAALAGLEAARQTAAQAGLDMHQGLARSSTAWVYLCLGLGAAATPIIEQAREQISVAAPVVRPLPDTLAALVEIAAGRLEAAEAVLPWAGESLPPPDISWPVPFWWMAAHCQLRFARHDYAGVLAAVEQWQSLYSETGTHYLRDEAHYWQARALAELGRAQEALEALRMAYAAAEAVGSRRGLARTLSALAAAEPDPERAAACRREAQSVISAVAANIDDDVLRAAWLNQER